MIDFSWLGLFYAMLFFGIYYLIIRKQVVILTEPTGIALITLSFSSVLLFTVIPDIEYSVGVVIHILILFFAIFFGDTLVFNCFKTYSIDNKNAIILMCNLNKMFLLSVFSWLSFLIILSLNGFFYLKNGIPLFFESNNHSKVIEYSGGFGIVRRLNWSLLYFNVICFMVLFGLKKKRVYIFLLFFLLGINILNGGKGAVIDFVMLLSILLLSPFFFFDNKKRVNLILILFALFGVVYSFFVLFLSSSDIVLAINKLYTRLLYYGDINLYLVDDYTYEHFTDLNFIDFIDYIVNHPLGLLRFTDYYTPLGTKIVEYYHGDAISLNGNFGPNLTYYATSMIFFGQYLGYVFSFLIGVIVGTIRRSYLLISLNKVFTFILFSYLYFLTYALITDPIMSIGRFFDSIIIITPIFFISLLLYFLLQCMKSVRKINE